MRWGTPTPIRTIKNDTIEAHARALGYQKSARISMVKFQRLASLLIGTAMNMTPTLFTLIMKKGKIMNNKNQSFNEKIEYCGLSVNGASRLLKVRPDTVRSWKNGRREVPSDVLLSMELYTHSRTLIFGGE